MNMGRRCRQSGVTLIELVISIVIVAIALTATVLVLSRSISTSANPVIEQQAIAIAESYIEEISSKAYTDPDGTNAGETRATFDDIADYNGLHDTGAHDQDGNAISGLGDYNVDVSVSSANLNAAPAKLITVTVHHSSIPAITLSTYRLNP